MNTDIAASRRLDIRMTGADRALIAGLQLALASPILPHPPAAAVIRAALREMHGRVVPQPSRGAGE